MSTRPPNTQNSSKRPHRTNHHLVSQLAAVAPSEGRKPTGYNEVDRVTTRGLWDY
jgi:hypothetical protein